MRFSSLLGPAAAGLSTLISLLPTAHALSFDAVSMPDFKLSSLGRVAITGDFDGVSLYEYKNQTEITNRNGSSILTPLPNGILTNLSSADGQINSMCSLTLKDGTFAGVVVGGSFETLGGVESPGAALFNPNSTKVTPLDGLNGTVSIVYCDKESSSVYLGGDFTHGNSSYVAAWSPDDGWTDLGFDGLNGPVKAILKSDNGHVVFAGDFDGLGSASSKSSKSKSKSKSSSSSEDDKWQILNLYDATITSNTDSSISGYNDPRNIVCSTSGEAGEDKTYLLKDNSPGFWQAELGFEFHPKKLRLYNTHYDGRGTKNFLFQARPDNGIMNMSYTDDGGNTAYCDQSCPLPSSDKDKYREFTLVNPVGMQGFKLQLQDYYGSGAGLNGIEVLHDEIISYAIQSQNEPTCAGIDYPSKSTKTGSWTEKNGYVSTDITEADSDASIVFEPDVKQSGNYTVLLFTPGCSDDGTCDSRGQANVSATFATSTDAAQPAPTTIFQTNEHEKYDTLYHGYVDASDDSFRPSVTLRPVPGQVGTTIVASRVQFNLLSADKSGGDLNGVYEYDPSSKSASTKGDDKSGINKATKELGRDASITYLAENNGVYYLSGNFSKGDYHNIMSVSDGNATAMPGGGLNKPVAQVATLHDILYVGGNFTDTYETGEKGLSYVASYSPSSNKWSAMGAGLNGPVKTIYPIRLNVSSDVNETTIAVSGDFTQIRATGGNPAVYVPGFAIWLPSNETWLQSLNVTQMEFAGQLTAVANVNDTSILAGSLATGGYTASGAVYLHESHGDVNLIPVSMKLNHTKPSAGVLTGAYDTASKRNTTILGGQFSALSSNGSVIENVAFLEGADSIYGLPAGLNSNSTVSSMLVHNDTLYAGGNLTGTIHDSKVGGIVTYDLTKGAYAESQPWALHGSDVSVNSIAVRPGTSEVFVGGNFKTAGSLPCASVCSLDSSGKWSWPGTSITGSALVLNFASSSTLYAVGDLSIGDDKTAVATLDVKKGTWSALSGASQSDVGGNVTAFAPGSKSLSNFWLAGTANNGSAFVLNYDGSKLQSPGSLFSKGTKIRGLEVVPLDKSHAASDLLREDQTLLILGSLIIPGFGHASAALYDGTDVKPFILSSKADGKPGSMSQLFSEHTNPFTTKCEPTPNK